ncbi:deleted in lung and esophageal cancer protein 1 [Lingula anatina]|uniref:Deleted in lung and esophageal cancer protein 1 n=1 Tax=Lingula anatina TaxID=7574 RepID=A0A1S3JXK0_LINAN|nr:deleted in lung and esophageal cancer protein 1 [Lingula anatina]|eukprot:XP_013414779.1 deleted in lung and esophageal cancer protein 1 [Lingula anatina]
MNTNMIVPQPQGQVQGQEPPMYLQRPSSARSQDVTHILAKTFRDFFTRETVRPETIRNLAVSREGGDEYHERYVEALQKVHAERERRMAEATMLERHIMQAQARAMSADEREMNRLASGHVNYPDLGLPPARSHFRSCIDSQLLRKHGLLCPEDFATEEPPPVPPPQAPKIPSYARETTTSLLHTAQGKEEGVKRLSPNMMESRDNILSGSDTEDAEQINTQNVSQSNGSPRNADWKAQLDPLQREVDRADLALLQARADYLKNPRFVPPSAPGGGRTLIKPKKKKPKSQRPWPRSEEPNLEPSVVFIPSPSVVTFSNYQVGQVYETTLELKNVTTALRQCRVIPPKSSYFSVGLGQFPGENGVVAPGMSCHYNIRFIPDSLGDYDDELTVQTQSSVPLVVKVQARRPPPVLSLPSNIDVDQCLVGGCKIIQMPLHNSGGSGRFSIMKRSSWPTTNFKNVSSTGSVQVPPFEIRPSVFELHHGDTMLLEVIFTPPSVKEYTQSLTIVCDNCHVQHFTIRGEGQTAGVDLVSVDGGKSEPLPGELCDVAAQHLVKFETLNPFTYTQKRVILQNITNVDLPFHWKIVKPHLRAVDIENPDTVIPVDRVIDLDSAFSIEPQSGILPAAKAVPFILTFAPAEVDKFHSVFHLILQEIPEPPEMENGEEKKENVREASNTSANEEGKVRDITTLEMEVKGESEPFKVLLQPYAIYISGKLLIGTSIRKQFQLENNSLSSVVFRWERCSDPHILQVEPPMGELGPGCIMDCELSVTGTAPGKINHTLMCHIDNLDQPVPLHIEAEIKGPEVVLENADVNFGLVRMGMEASCEILLRNTCQVPAKWTLQESPDCLQGKVSEFTFKPCSGELKPLETKSVPVTFTPSSCRSVRTVFELKVQEGNECNISVRGEVQSPQACLLNCQLALDEVYVDIPITPTVKLLNQTQLATVFEWHEVEGEHAELCSVEVTPKSGVLQPREELDITINFTAHKQGDISDLRIPCVIGGMEQALGLAVKAHVKGLCVSYRTAEEPEDLGDYSTCTDGLSLNYGDDVQLGDTPRRYVFMKNNSAIAAPYSIHMDYFVARPPTPPTDGKDKGKMPNKSQRRQLLSKTTNLADPSSKSTTKAQAEFCQVMLRDGKGAAFSIQPSSGVLEPFSELMIEITAFNDMWGHYQDKLVCKVDKLDIVQIPVTMTVVGCPLIFQMASTQPGQDAVVRFGTHVSGVPPINRQCRIMNSSPYDIRVDWQLFNIDENDRQILDFVVTIGDGFPLRDEHGNEIKKKKGPPAALVKRVPTDMIPETPDTSPYPSREVSSTDTQATEEKKEAEAEEKEKLVKVTMRMHEGRMGNSPFSIVPAQMIIPAKGTSVITARFTPFANTDVESGISLAGYALAYMSLDEVASNIPGKVKRVAGYEMVPLRLDLSSHVKPALLTIECTEDEGMRYRTAASDLLKDGKVGKESLRVCSCNLSNYTGTPLTFKLLTRRPFTLVDIDPAADGHLGSGQVQESEMCTLRPQHNLLVKVGFRVSLDLINYADILEPDQEKDGITLIVHEGERKLHFRYDMVAEFNNGTTQKLPLYATLTVPSLMLSKESVDFGTCLVGQQRELELILSNKTGSASFWTAIIESKSDTCTADTFRITPASGVLDAHITHISNSKVLLKLHFIAKHNEDYEAVFLVQGMLGEEPRRLYVKGQGSYDERHEALVNV